MCPVYWTHIAIHFCYQKTIRSVFYMKGYVVETGYMGYVNGEYMLFADEEDYREYFCDMN